MCVRYSVCVCVCVCACVCVIVCECVCLCVWECECYSVCYSVCESVCVSVPSPCRLILTPPCVTRPMVPMATVDATMGHSADCSAWYLYTLQQNYPEFSAQERPHDSCPSEHVTAASLECRVRPPHDAPVKLWLMCYWLYTYEFNTFICTSALSI